jgi:GT2 family glycosyltransferase
VFASKSTIALITVLYKCETHLERYVRTLGNQTDRDFVLIAVDNASPDRSAEVLEKLSAKYCVPLLLQRVGSNVGIAEGNNVGIRLALQHEFQHIVLSNNDIDLPVDSIERIHKEVIARRTLAWTPKALTGDTDKIWYAGGSFSDIRGRCLHTSASDALAKGEDHSYPVTYAPTCFMYVNADVFRRIGVMDRNYFVYKDDADFCKRMEVAGIPLIYDPTLVFRHYVGSSSGGDLSPFYLRISTRNKFYFIHKHFSGLFFFAATAIGLAGKVGQLLMPDRREHTWLGLKDAFKMMTSNRAERDAGIEGERNLSGPVPGSTSYVCWPNESLYRSANNG